MKRLLSLLLLCVYLLGWGRTDTADPWETEKGTERPGQDTDTTVTVMIYMDAATLESGEEPFAQYDMEQMLAAELSDRVTVLIQTGGTSHWANPDISTQTTQRYRITESELELIEDTGMQQDMTDAETLKNFLLFAGKEAPADRYMLILWGHGRGPQIGYGMDEYRDVLKAMSWDDMADAIQSAETEAGFWIEWIGFDVCLTGTLETVYALRNCCDYLVVSEDYEPAYGWQYTNLLEALSEDPSIGQTSLAEVIVDGFVSEAEKSGDRGILAVFKTDYAEELMQAWQQFCEVSTQETVQELVHRVWMDEALLTPVPSSADGYVSDDDRYSLQDYLLTDLMAICELSDLPEAKRCMILMEESRVCVDSYHMARTMCGLAVYTGQ